MWYQTDLMKEILKSLAAQRMVDNVTPIYGDSYYGLWLFEIMGLEIDKVKDFLEDMYEELFPETATWSIPYWEKAFGISGTEGKPQEQRRQQILLKRQKLPMNPARMKQILEGIAGVEVMVTEHAAKNTLLITLLGTVKNLDDIKKLVEEIKPAHIFCEIKISETLVQDTELSYRILESEQETETIIFKEVL